MEVVLLLKVGSRALVAANFDALRNLVERAALGVVWEEIGLALEVLFFGVLDSLVEVHRGLKCALVADETALFLALFLVAGELSIHGEFLVLTLDSVDELVLVFFSEVLRELEVDQSVFLDEEVNHLLEEPVLFDQEVVVLFLLQKLELRGFERPQDGSVWVEGKEFDGLFVLQFPVVALFELRLAAAKAADSLFVLEVVHFFPLEVGLDVFLIAGYAEYAVTVQEVGGLFHKTFIAVHY